MFMADQFCEYIIKPALEDIGMYSKAAEQLLLGTACVESNLGTYLHQIKGPALGVFQIEPATHSDVWENYLRYRGDLREIIWDMVPDDGWEQEQGGNPDPSLLITDLRYAAVIARIIYRRSPMALPFENDWRSVAHVWKKVYNTHLGAGTVEKFMRSLVNCRVTSEGVR